MTTKEIELILEENKVLNLYRAAHIKAIQASFWIHDDKEIKAQLRLGESVLENGLPIIQELLKNYRDVLNRIAAWDEGDTVNSGFDEPGAAQLARSVLPKREKTTPPPP